MTIAHAASAVVACLLAATSIVQGDRPAFVYGEVVVTGATFTNAQGINAGGDIVGFYRDANNRTHGFLWQQGEVTRLDYADEDGMQAAYTDARAISPGGDVLGAYRMAGEPAVNFHGYLLKKDGTLLKVDYPGFKNTIPQRILPDGTILGCRHEDDLMETMRGIRMGPHGNEETDAFASMHNGQTPGGGLIAGLFTNMMTGRAEGYVIERGEFMPFVVPDSISTAAWDVNPRGEIVGVYTDANNRVHGFVRDGDDYITLDVPGATATRAFGINAGGDVVGVFVAGGVTRAFVASRTRAR